VIGGRRVLAVIPARGGSKGLPGKHLMQAGARPLIAWTIAAAHGARHVDRTVLSSDDEAIIAAASVCSCDVPFRRPAELATDEASSIDVVLHAVDALPGYDVVALLQPTSPLRTAADIDAAFTTFAAARAPASVSVSPVEQSPYWMYRLGDGGTMQPIVEPPPGVTRRQDLPSIYALNGAIYIADIVWLRQTRSFVTPETVAHVMPLERSVDIDTAADFEIFRKAVSDGIRG
jgi:N-acylneuraminate cytidylyltransferase